MAYIRAIEDCEWIATVHPESGLPGALHVGISVHTELMDPSGHMPNMTLPLIIMLEDDGAHALLALLQKFFAHNPKPPPIQLPGSN